MAEFKKKDTYKFWHSPLMLVVLFSVFTLFAYNMVGLIKKQRETSRNKTSELNKIAELRKRESTLKTDIDKLNTPEGVEESVREKFQVVKPGEKEVLIVQGDEQVQAQAQATDHTFWGWIKRLFGSK